MFKFGNLDSFKNDVGRNTFDLSFGTNATFKMGKLYPVFCKEVLPRDTWKIDPKVAIQMMPTVFPLKTRLRCFVHFYYVKNRTLWKDWQKFINNSYGLGNENYNIVPPYISHSYDKKLHGTGSLADYLGWPTALASETSEIIRTDTSTRATIVDTHNLSLKEIRNSPFFDVQVLPNTRLLTNINNVNVGEIYHVNEDYSSAHVLYKINVRPAFKDNVRIHLASCVNICYKTNDNSTSLQTIITDYNGLLAAKDTKPYVNENGAQERVIAINSINGVNCYMQGIYSNGYVDEDLSYLVVDYGGSDPDVIGSYDYETDWWTGMNISALPFRAYESIYNAYYRNWQADPLMDSQNRPNYDTYVRNVEGGADSLDYDFYLRNYEKDMFTSAHPTPQMGVAPLVGITTLGQATFSYNGTEYSAQATFADDNETIQDFRVSANTPAAVGASATALTGISINDLRSVNALQRYLENGVRASYKYRNQIAAHFGSAPEFDAVDMPMFIGGIATDLGQNVTSTTGDYTDSAGNSVPAGTPISNGYFAYDGNDTIEKYCDEHGFIMGILSIVPIPNYPQGLSPMWRKEDYMRYFTPEMGHLGYQPIKSNEIALFRQLEDKTGQVIPDSEVFGYQRSWYEYCGSNDEVHGEFRTTMRDFMLSRWFSEIPKLDPEFIGVDSSKLSYIFADTNDNDKFIGQLYFSAFAKRPIPEYGTPKLD